MPPGNSRPPILSEGFARGIAEQLMYQETFGGTAYDTVPANPKGIFPGLAGGAYPYFQDYYWTEESPAEDSAGENSSFEGYSSTAELFYGDTSKYQNSPWQRDQRALTLPKVINFDLWVKLAEAMPAVIGLALSTKTPILNLAPQAALLSIDWLIEKCKQTESSYAYAALPTGRVGGKNAHNHNNTGRPSNSNQNLLYISFRSGFDDEDWNILTEGFGEDLIGRIEKDDLTLVEFSSHLLSEAVAFRNKWTTYDKALLPEVKDAKVFWHILDWLRDVAIDKNLNNDLRQVAEQTLQKFGPEIKELESLLTDALREKSAVDKIRKAVKSIPPDPANIDWGKIDKLAGEVEADTKNPEKVVRFVKALAEALNPYVEHHQAAIVLYYLSDDFPEGPDTAKYALVLARDNLKVVKVEIGARYSKTLLSILEGMTASYAQQINSKRPYAVEEIESILQSIYQDGNPSNPGLYAHLMYESHRAMTAFEKVAEVTGVLTPDILTRIEDPTERKEKYYSIIKPILDVYEKEILPIIDRQNTLLLEANVGKDNVIEYLFELSNPGVTWEDAVHLIKLLEGRTRNESKKLTEELANVLGKRVEEVGLWDTGYAVRKMAAQISETSQELTITPDEARSIVTRFVRDGFKIDLNDPKHGLILRITKPDALRWGLGSTMPAAEGALAVAVDVSDPANIRLSELSKILHEVGHALHLILAKEHLGKQGVKSPLLTLTSSNILSEGFAKMMERLPLDEGWASKYLSHKFPLQYLSAYRKVHELVKAYNARANMSSALAAHVIYDNSRDTIETKKAAVKGLEEHYLGLKATDGTLPFAVISLTNPAMGSYLMNYVLAEGFVSKVSDLAAEEGVTPFQYILPLLKLGGALTPTKLDKMGLGVKDIIKKNSDSGSGGKITPIKPIKTYPSNEAGSKILEVDAPLIKLNPDLQIRDEERKTVEDFKKAITKRGGSVTDEEFKGSCISWAAKELGWKLDTATFAPLLEKLFEVGTPIEAKDAQLGDVVAYVRDDSRHILSGGILGDIIKSSLSGEYRKIKGRFFGAKHVGIVSKVEGRGISVTSKFRGYPVLETPMDVVPEGWVDHVIIFRVGKDQHGSSPPSESNGNTGTESPGNKGGPLQVKTVEAAWASVGKQLKNPFEASIQTTLKGIKNIGAGVLSRPAPKNKGPKSAGAIFADGTVAGKGARDKTKPTPIKASETTTKSPVSTIQLDLEDGKDFDSLAQQLIKKYKTGAYKKMTQLMKLEGKTGSDYRHILGELIRHPNSDLEIIVDKLAGRGDRDSLIHFLDFLVLLADRARGRDQFRSAEANATFGLLIHILNLNPLTYVFSHPRALPDESVTISFTDPSHKSGDLKVKKGGDIQIEFPAHGSFETIEEFSGYAQAAANLLWEYLIIDVKHPRITVAGAPKHFPKIIELTLDKPSRPWLDAYFEDIFSYMQNPMGKRRPRPIKTTAGFITFCEWVRDKKAETLVYMELLSRLFKKGLLEVNRRKYQWLAIGCALGDRMKGAGIWPDGVFDNPKSALEWIIPRRDEIRKAWGKEGKVSLTTVMNALYYHGVFKKGNSQAFHRAVADYRLGERMKGAGIWPEGIFSGPESAVEWIIANLEEISRKCWIKGEEGEFSPLTIMDALYYHGQLSGGQQENLWFAGGYALSKQMKGAGIWPEGIFGKPESALEWITHNLEQISKKCRKKPDEGEFSLPTVMRALHCGGCLGGDFQSYQRAASGHDLGRRMQESNIWPEEIFGKPESALKWITANLEDISKKCWKKPEEGKFSLPTVIDALYYHKMLKGSLHNYLGAASGYNLGERMKGAGIWPGPKDKIFSHATQALEWIIPRLEEISKKCWIKGEEGEFSPATVMDALYYHGRLKGGLQEYQRAAGGHALGRRMKDSGIWPEKKLDNPKQALKWTIPRLEEISKKCWIKGEEGEFSPATVMDALYLHGRLKGHHRDYNKAAAGYVLGKKMQAADILPPRDKWGDPYKLIPWAMAMRPYIAVKLGKDAPPGIQNIMWAYYYIGIDGPEIINKLMHISESAYLLRRYTDIRHQVKKSIAGEKIDTSAFTRLDGKGYLSKRTLWRYLVNMRRAMKEGWPILDLSASEIAAGLLGYEPIQTILDEIGVNGDRGLRNRLTGRLEKSTGALENRVPTEVAPKEEVERRKLVTELVFDLLAYGQSHRNKLSLEQREFFDDLAEIAWLTAWLHHLVDGLPVKNNPAGGAGSGGSGIAKTGAEPGSSGNKGGIEAKSLDKDVDLGLFAGATAPDPISERLKDPWEASIQSTLKDIGDSALKRPALKNKNSASAGAIGEVFADGTVTGKGGGAGVEADDASLMAAGQKGDKSKRSVGRPYEDYAIVEILKRVLVFQKIQTTHPDAVRRAIVKFGSGSDSSRITQSILPQLIGKGVSALNGEDLAFALQEAMPFFDEIEVGKIEVWMKAGISPLINKLEISKLKAIDQRTKETADPNNYPLWLAARLAAVLRYMPPERDQTLNEKFSSLLANALVRNLFEPYITEEPVGAKKAGRSKYLPDETVVLWKPGDSKTGPGRFVYENGEAFRPIGRDKTYAVVIDENPPDEIKRKVISKLLGIFSGKIKTVLSQRYLHHIPARKGVVIKIGATVQSNLELYMKKLVVFDGENEILKASQKKPKDGKKVPIVEVIVGDKAHNHAVLHGLHVVGPRIIDVRADGRPLKHQDTKKGSKRSKPPKRAGRLAEIKTPDPIETLRKLNFEKKGWEDELSRAISDLQTARLNPPHLKALEGALHAYQIEVHLRSSRIDQKLEELKKAHRDLLPQISAPVKEYHGSDKPFDPYSNEGIAPRKKWKWFQMVKTVKGLLQQLPHEDRKEINDLDLRNAMMRLLHSQRAYISEDEIEAVLKELILLKNGEALVFPTQGEALAKKYKLMKKDIFREHAVGSDDPHGEHTVFIGSSDEGGRHGMVRVNTEKTSSHNHSIKTSGLPTLQDLRNIKPGQWEPIDKLTQKQSNLGYETVLFTKLSDKNEVAPVRLMEWKNADSEELGVKDDMEKIDGVVVYARTKKSGPPYEYIRRVFIPLEVLRKAAKSGPQKILAEVPETSEKVYVVVKAKPGNGHKAEGFNVNIDGKGWKVPDIPYWKGWNRKNTLTALETLTHPKVKQRGGFVWHGDGKESGPTSLPKEIKVSWRPGDAEASDTEAGSFVVEGDEGAKEFMPSGRERTYSVKFGKDQTAGLAAVEKLLNKFGGLVAHVLRRGEYLDLIPLSRGMEIRIKSLSPGGTPYIDKLEMTREGKKLFTAEVGAIGEKKHFVVVEVVEVPGEKPVEYGEEVELSPFEKLDLHKKDLVPLKELEKPKKPEKPEKPEEPEPTPTKNKVPLDALLDVIPEKWRVGAIIDLVSKSAVKYISSLNKKDREDALRERVDVYKQIFNALDNTLNLLDLSIGTDDIKIVQAVLENLAGGLESKRPPKNVDRLAARLAIIEWTKDVRTVEGIESGIKAKLNKGWKIQELIELSYGINYSQVDRSLSKLSLHNIVKNYFLKMTLLTLDKNQTYRSWNKWLDRIADHLKTIRISLSKYEKALPPKQKGLAGPT